MNVTRQSVHIAFYGDDFTGSTDALESLTSAGLKTLLFLETPSKDDLLALEGADAIGIAGMTRSLAPSQMEEELLSAFELMADLSPQFVHYKVCSTFDSSPEIGNIGTTIRCGQQVFQNSVVPILVAAPHLGRYSAFGNLYARMGTAQSGEIHRLDRHPSMSKHPVTPATESDLRRHLARQYDASMGLVDLVDLELSHDKIMEKINQLSDSGSLVLFFDAMYDHQMAKIGAAINDLSDENNPQFLVGSSGIGKALGDFWLDKGIFSRRTNWGSAEAVDSMLVVSGSCSPVTANQIDWAVANGFEEVAIQPDVLQGEITDDDLHAYHVRVDELLSSGKSVIVHTCKGPSDPRVALSKKLLEGQGLTQTAILEQTSRKYGSVLGQIAKDAIKRSGLKRLVIAGGDTSGLVARTIGIKAVEMIAPLYTGAPLCLVKGSETWLNGLEVNIKGGQVGDERYFEVVRNGEFIFIA